VLTLALCGQVRVVRVLGKAERRGSATDAKVLYEDIATQQTASSLAENIGA
jgi:ribosomal 50S subunit-recycling heat shock protein